MRRQCVPRQHRTRSTNKDQIVSAACAYSDFFQFFRSWVADPLRVAAVAPSGDSLARLMTQEIHPADGPVLELGVGTGVFTRALLARGIRENDLTLVEYGSDFMRVLQHRFPRARVLWMDASQLAAYDLFAGASVGAVVSGLPLLSMPPRKLLSILSGAFSYLRPTGRFYQFTYGPRCPVPRPILDRLGLKATRIGGTVRNLPPAAVYRITRRQPVAIARRAAIPAAPTA
jgi:phospholipid N-methyltransferase